MACIGPDGTLQESAKALLRLLEQPLTPEEIAAKIDRPLYWTRMSLRELVSADLARVEAERYVISDKGRAKL